MKILTDLCSPLTFAIHSDLDSDPNLGFFEEIFTPWSKEMQSVFAVKSRSC